jgi:hypothetical protein
VSSPPLSRGTRIFASLALLSFAATFLAAQVDFARRNHVGIAPERYWWPQFTQIWLPGTVTALVLGVVAFILHRRRPGA